MTRAKERLFLSYAFRASRFGDYEPNLPSRFLEDLPRELLAGQGAEASRAYQNSYGRMTSWADDLPTVGGRTASMPSRSTPRPARFQAGMRVIHARFGEGIVISARSFSDSEEVEVQFVTAGRKRIDGNFLDPLGG